MSDNGLTINQYLQILPNYMFPENNILVALGSQNIKSGSKAFQFGDDGVEPTDWQRKRDLAEARMWEFAAGLANISGGSQKLEGRSFTGKGFQITGDDRLRWQQEAEKLRSKWSGEGHTDIYDGTLTWGMR